MTTPRDHPLLAYLRLIRLPNLLIVAFTQYLLQYSLLVPAFEANGLQAALALPHFSLLALSTMLLAASGYVINDLIDLPIDRINKPATRIIEKRISTRWATIYYYCLIGSGFAISLYLAWYVSNLPLVLIYPTAVFLLYGYSRWWKAQVLWGNVVVALFCALVAGIVFFAERFTVNDLFLMDFAYGYETSLLFASYLLFAFLSTLLREIIKDMEDLYGDQQLKYRTLPIVWGIPTAKRVALLTGGILTALLLLGGYILWERGQWLIVLFLLIGIVLPLAYVLSALRRAVHSQDFHALSQFCKYIMLSGLVGLFLVAVGGD